MYNTSFLTEALKDKCPVRCDYDLSTNSYPRKLNGNLEDIDLYGYCRNSVKIFYFGSGIFEAYIPSLSRGRNVTKMIYGELINPENAVVSEIKFMRKGKEVTRKTVKIKNNKLYKKEINEGNIIFTYFENDAEVTFHFKNKDLDKILPYLQPMESCINRSPFSTKNLPKSDYDILEDDLNTYKEITSVIPKEEMLQLSHITSHFLKTLCNKRWTSEQQKADMRMKGLSGKDYIHSIGKWNDFMKFIKKELESKE